MSRDGVGFPGLDFLRTDEDVAVLEERGGVAEDEIDVADDFAGFVELTEGMGVESVLVSDEFDAVENGAVAVGSECHRLVCLWAGRVLDR